MTEEIQTSATCAICEHRKAIEYFSYDFKVTLRGVISRVCDSCAETNMKPDLNFEGGCVNEVNKEICGKLPVVPMTKMCGFCTFGGEEFADGKWWHVMSGKELPASADGATETTNVPSKGMADTIPKDDTGSTVDAGGEVGSNNLPKDVPQSDG